MGSETWGHLRITLQDKAAEARRPFRAPGARVYASTPRIPGGVAQISRAVPCVRRVFALGCPPDVGACLAGLRGRLARHIPKLDPESTCGWPSSTHTDSIERRWRQRTPAMAT